MRFTFEEFGNGLRLVQVPMSQVQSASVVIYIGVGSRYERAETAGISHLLEHMLFKGTQKRPRARDISEAIESVGGILNASTDKELTVYWAKTAREHAGLAIDVLADMLRNSRLRRSDVLREKNIILEELAMLADDPQDWVHVLADETLWACQPMGMEIAGTRQSVAGLTERDVREAMSAFYGPNNALVSVAGGIDEAAVSSLVEQGFDGWTAVPVTTPEPAVIPDAGPRSRVERKPLEQANVCIVFPGMSRSNPDRWALQVLCTIMGGGTSSRLFLRLRERLGLVYDVQMFTNHFADTGSIVVSAGMDAANVDRAVEAVFEELRRLERRGVAAGDLARAKSFFRGRMLLGLEDTHAVANWFGSQMMLENGVTQPEQAAEWVDRVTTRDLLRVARTYLRPESARIAGVGPLSTLQPLGRLAGA